MPWGSKVNDNPPGILAEGTYLALVGSITFKLSNKGNDMAVVELIINDDEIGEQSVADYLLPDGKMSWRVSQFLKAIYGEWDKTKAVTQEIMSGCEGQWVKVKLVIEEYNGRDQNHVEEYFNKEGKPDAEAKPKPKPPAQAAKPKAKNIADEDAMDLDLDDKIPF